MSKYKRGQLHSGSDKGPPVKSRDQAIAIMMSEKKKAGEGKKEYMAHDDGGPVGKDMPIPKLEKGETGPQSPPDYPHRVKPMPEPGVKGSFGRAAFVAKGGNVNKYAGGGKVSDEEMFRKMDAASPTYREQFTKPTSGAVRTPHTLTPPENTAKPSSLPGQALKKGGPMKKYDDGGPVSGDVKSENLPPPTAAVKPPSIPSAKVSGKGPLPPKGGGGDTPAITVLPGAPDFKPDTKPIVTARKGGPIKAFNKGGEACASNAKQFKQNLVETAVNPTGKMALAKGGEVAWKKPSWRKW